MAAQEPSRDTRFTTCPLTKCAFGSPTRPDLDLRLEKAQNLVSTNVPEAIESLRDSCNRSGIPVIVKVATPMLSEVLEKLKGCTRFG